MADRNRLINPLITNQKSPCPKVMLGANSNCSANQIVLGPNPTAAYPEFHVGCTLG